MGRRPWLHLNGGRAGDSRKVASRHHVGIEFELERRVDKGRHCHAGGALAGVAKGDFDCVAFPHIAAAHMRGQALEARPCVAACLVVECQLAAIAGLSGGVARCGRIAHLEAAKVRHGAEGNADGAGVVQPIPAKCVD